MNKNYEMIHRYDFLTKELLEQEYITNGLTDREIAKKYNMPSKVVVWRKRQKLGIANKLPNKSNNNATINRKFSISIEKAKKLLDEGKKYKDISKEMGCSVLVAKRRFKELGLVLETEQTEHYKYLDIILTDSQKQLLIGSSLGDGNITISNAYGCTHSVKQSEYFFYKMNKLSDIHSGKFQKTKGTDPSGSPTNGLRFTTGCNKFLIELRKIFYPDGIKIFPYNYILDNLREEGLSYWFMDDGSFHQENKCVRLSTEGFTYDDVILIQKYFLIKWKLDARIHKREEPSEENGRTYQQYTIVFTKDSSDKFIEMVKPFIPECMLYKTGNTDAYLKWKTNNQ